MIQINKIQLTARLGKSEIRFVNDKKVAQLRVASGTRYKDANGEWSERATWFDVVFWEQRADFIEKNVNQGDLLYIEGRIESRTYKAQDGTDRTIYEIRGTDVQIVYKKNPETERAAAPSGSDDMPLF